MKKVNSTYINPNSNNSVQIMSIGLHGSNGKAVWDVAEIPDFLREFATVKYFGANDEIESSLVNKGFLGGTMGNLLRAISCFVHQALVHIDPNLFSSEHVEHALCRHPELTVQLLETFRRKFDPDLADLESFQKLRERFLISVDKLDTGNEENDYLRKSVLRMAMSFITHCLKTNFYRLNYTAFSFRLDPSYLDDIPFERSTKFPELPYGIFFIKGMNFFGFHIRFKDLARGGLRTVFPDLPEVVKAEENNVFAECYNLAYTQQMKNKDIPEGGAKAIIFISPSEQMEAEVEIFKDELVFAGIPEAETESQVVKFRQEQKLEYLYQAQRCFVESLVIIINCDSEGKIRARQIIDYWKRPEYLYLGPDENMHDTIIQWIADYSEKYHYKPGSAFISSKPLVGINHKEYGVTSLGVNVYLEETLKFLGIDPKRETFTIKMSGGPDGDVAGNEILNLLEFYPETAKLVALTDISGTIRDPSGLDLEVLKTLFHQSKPIRHYPPHKLHEGGFLLDRFTKRSQTELSQQTLCYRASQGQVIEDWLSGSEMNSLYRNNLHQMKADVFLPAGGRPRTLNESNYKDFLDETGKPTAKAIIEGANLYLTQRARRNLEKLGVLIIKDSSANKCGVICSSFEVLSGLALGDELFLKEKESLVKEILARLHELALLEATLLLSTHKATGEYLTDISEKVSQRINFFTYQILDFLDQNSPSHDPNDPAVQCFLSYCLPTLTAKYQDRLLKEIPEHHKKAIIASLIGANLVYNRGLEWSPSVVDILPLLLNIVVDTKK